MEQNYRQKLNLKKIKIETALIFDLDGTLVDTDYANFLAYKEAILKIKGLELDLLHLDKQRFTRKKLKKVIPKITNLECDQIIELKNNIFYKYLSSTKINTVFLKLIQQYSKTNTIILATNSSKARAEMTLKFYNLVECFDFLFYKEDYNNKIGKYNYVLNFLKLDPKSVMIFDNEQLEINNAQLAGVPAKNIIKSKGDYKDE